MPITSQPITDFKEVLAMFPEEKSGNLRQPLNADQHSRLMAFIAKGELTEIDCNWLIVCASSAANDMYNKKRPNIDAAIEYMNIAAHAVKGCADYAMTYAKVLPWVLNNATSLAMRMDYSGEKEGAQRCYGVIREACKMAADKERRTDETIEEAVLPARP